MNNWVVAPMLIPLFTAVLLIFLNKRLRLQRWISLISVMLNAAAAVFLMIQVRTGGIQTLNMSGWAPPYGIVLVADMFAVLLVLAASIVSACCLLYSFRGIDEDREKHYFYPLVHFMLAGVNGSFLTGDLFNLFVCFELMLMSSYALIVLGGTKRQFRETLHYILINVLSSTLFVASVAYLYGATGTLNLAHLSLRIAESGQSGPITAVAALLLVVFSVKAGLFLFFWLPGSYGAPPAAISALFGALLTKVGMYALIRVFTLVFYHETSVTHTLIGLMGIATIVLGGFGAVSQTNVNRILGYNVIASIGFISLALAVSNEDALKGAVFYLVHDMIVKALLFLLAGILVAETGTERINRMGGALIHSPLLGWMFLAASLAVVGVPPLSGFPGKLLILQGSLEEGRYVIAAAGVLLSLLLLYSLIKIFILGFWGEPRHPREAHWKQPRKLLLSSAPLMLLIVLLGLFAEPVMPYMQRAADILNEPSIYIQAVLKE
ncbi:Na+/H+ antiporter subunit D [Saccharibacillus alkalitolerans]|uniref:Na+/H+ antiporter subunit D n=1 Tax=Saccharibacillus alkalitolerans TaxID=2705290 RepID=A0ABX0FB23_9BACL|nr:Na+/H+ antiporter subunit D [Saccharibacillus alkalitolerans]NGZ77560.1 Na+/H+ antiporter subunit D [Saccharibacillus alkalitolerans]